MFYGKGAGKLPTAGAVVSDIIDIASRGENQPLQTPWTEDDDKFVYELPSEYLSDTVKDLGKPLI